MDQRLREKGIKAATSLSKILSTQSHNNSTPVQNMYSNLYQYSEKTDHSMQSRSMATDMHLAGFSLNDLQIALQTKDRPDLSKQIAHTLPPSFIGL